MGIERERKYLVLSDAWRAETTGSAKCRQGYLTTGPPVAVRVRIMDNTATLNLKRATTSVVRDEYEYAIPLSEAHELIENLSQGRIVEKTRHFVKYQGLDWEIDEFEGDNVGLIVAEVELDDEHQHVPMPPWVGDEVSSNPKYLNASLSTLPYSQWPPEDMPE